mmetsp:Transcript_95220/g.269503  ORF Transcript_95220/g.269503 Transcript_95220/m.269503 type:complete len:219 (-) Transcript_95220:92-748(-)
MSLAAREDGPSESSTRRGVGAEEPPWVLAVSPGSWDSALARSCSVARAAQVVYMRLSTTATASVAAAPSSAAAAGASAAWGAAWGGARPSASSRRSPAAPTAAPGLATLLFSTSAAWGGAWPGALLSVPQPPLAASVAAASLPAREKLDSLAPPPATSPSAPPGPGAAVARPPATSAGAAAAGTTPGSSEPALPSTGGPAACDGEGLKHTDEEHDGTL